MYKKILLSASFLFVFALTTFAQAPISFDNFLTENFNTTLSSAILVLSFLAAKIPALKNINKAYITIAVIVLLGAFYMIQYSVPLKEVWLSALLAIATYLGIGKQLLTAPLLKELPSGDESEA